MRALNIALFHNLPSGGAKRAVYDLSHQLAQRGHQLTEYRFPTANTDFLPLTDAVVGTIELPFTPLPYKHVPIPGISPHVNALRRIRTLQALDTASRDFAAQIDAKGFDVVWLNDCIISLKPYLLRYLKTPSVFYIHHGPYEREQQYLQVLDPHRNEESVKQRFYGLTDKRRAVFETKEERRTSQVAPYVVTNSFFTAESYFQYYGVPALVSYLGVDTEKFAPTGDPRGDYVISVGSLIYRKGHRFVIEALGLLPENVRPRMVITADANYSEEHQLLLQLAEKHQVQLEINSVIDDKHLRQLYANARLLAYAPILEPFGLVPLEAMAAGTPIVAVAEAGVRETVDAQVGILTDRNTANFAAAVQALLADPERAEQLGAVGRERALTQWSWANATDALEHHLQQAMLGVRTNAGIA